jgi:predicted Zn-ribbon and HTH transcriptional regulator
VIPPCAPIHGDRSLRRGCVTTSQKEEYAMTTTVETFRCMMCGHEFVDNVEKDEDKERSCPKCRSNSIRHLKKKRPVKESS